MLGMEYRKEHGGEERGILGTQKNQPLKEYNPVPAVNEGLSIADFTVAPLRSAG